jgi:hypothetical protein
MTALERMSMEIDALLPYLATAAAVRATAAGALAGPVGALVGRAAQSIAGERARNGARRLSWQAARAGDALFALAAVRAAMEVAAIDVLRPPCAPLADDRTQMLGVCAAAGLSVLLLTTRLSASAGAFVCLICVKERSALTPAAAAMAVCTWLRVPKRAPALCACACAATCIVAAVHGSACAAAGSAALSVECFVCSLRCALRLAAQCCTCALRSLRAVHIQLANTRCSVLATTEVL